MTFSDDLIASSESLFGQLGSDTLLLKHAAHLCLDVWILFLNVYTGWESWDGNINPLKAQIYTVHTRTYIAFPIIFMVITF